MKNFSNNDNSYWSVKTISSELVKFISLYKKRPIKDNINGAGFDNMFALYFILIKTRPKFIIESGVLRGQTTWLIEKTLPKSKILSIDINLKNRKYISKKAKYSNLDFKFHNFYNIPKNTLAFLDDHQNHFERLKQCKFFGIRNIVLEDNYPVSRGDFYTIRHAIGKSGFYHPLSLLNLLKTTYLFFLEILKKKIFNNYYISLDYINSRLRDVAPNSYDIKTLSKNIETYYEFPKLDNILKILKKNKSHKILEEINALRNNSQSNNYLTFITLK
jgi:hypothetical protein